VWTSKSSWRRWRTGTRIPDRANHSLTRRVEYDCDAKDKFLMATKHTSATAFRRAIQTSRPCAVPKIW
jgi:hypothetical protein